VNPRVNTEDLIDSLIVAEILGLSHRNTVSTYLRRYPDMPRPVVELGTGRVRLWLRSEMVAWARSRERAMPAQRRSSAS
jgi:glutathione-regulated potassium-efflux system ancillary protein KefG